MAKWQDGKMTKWQDGNWIVDCRLLIEVAYPSTIINHQSSLPPCCLAVLPSSRCATLPPKGEKH